MTSIKRRTSSDPGTGSLVAGASLGGKTVTITYSVYTGALTEKQEIVVPAGHTWTVPNPSTYLGASIIIDAVTGVRIFGPAASPSGLPAGQYWVDNSGNFTFASADTGRNFIITWTASTGNSTDAPTTLNFESTTGPLAQTPFAFYNTAHLDMALPYPGICKIQSSHWDLGASGSLPQIQFEAFSKGLAAGYLDCNPCTVFSALLTNPVYGLNFPATNIGFVADPLLDSTGLYTAISRTADFQHNAFDWFQAHSYFVTATVENQSTVANIMGPILEAGQCAPVFSEGLLKLRPYGDTSIAGNGSIYQPDTQPIVDITTDDIIGEIDIERAAEDGNVFDRVQIEFKNRDNAYQQDTIVEDYPGTFVNRTESPQNWDFIRSHTVAQWAGNLRVKRLNNIRATYKFTLVTVFTYLEPMDLITLTDVNLGLDHVPVRLTACKYQHGVGIECEAESFPYGIAKPTLLTKQASLYDDPNPANRAPGSSVPLILELPPAIIDFTAGSSHTARIYADPANATGDWGGAQVQLSADGVVWESVGTINSQAVVGTLNTTLNVGTGDPDTQSFNVTLNSTEQIFDSSTFDFANKRENTLLALVDGSGNVEIVSYHNATLIDQNKYTLSNFHRALYGTTRRSFASGTSKMIKIDQGHVNYTYPNYLIGQTVHVKLMSFNSVGARLESFDAVTTYNFTLTGDFASLLDPSGLVIGLHGLAYKDNVDLATSDVINKTANHITYVTGGASVDSLKPAEAGAEVTTGKSLDILADGSTYARPLASRLSSGKPLIDFSEGIHLNPDILHGNNVGKNAAVLSHSASITIIGRGPCADMTDSSGAGNDMSYTTTVPVNLIIDLGAVYPQISGFSFTAYWPGDGRMIPASGSIDASNDNVTYTNNVGTWSSLSGSIVRPFIPISGLPGGTARYLRINITAVPLTTGGLTTFTLGNFAFYSPNAQVTHSLDFNVKDGSTYARPLASRISSGKPLIDFSEAIHLNKNIDNVADGTSFVRTSPNEKTGAGRGFTAIDSSNIVVTGGIDFTRSYTNKHLDNIPDGSTYARPLATRISTGKPLIDFSEGIHLNKNVDNVPDGTSRFAGIQAAATGDGFQILSNPDFAGGSLTGWSVYDNNSTGHVTLTAVADATAPNSSGQLMRVAYSAGGENPGLGGFTKTLSVDAGPFAMDTYHKGSTIIWRIRALIPSGHSIQFATNATGTGSTFTWLTSQAGTGAYVEYVAKQIIGTTGSFSSTGFFYLDGVFTTSFNMDVAVVSAVCITHPAGIGVSSVDANRKAIIDFASGHLNKNIDNIADGSSFVRTTPNDKTGAGRGFNAIDSSNIVVAGGVDFSRAYTNKQLDNIGDGTTYKRLANVHADNTIHVSSSLNPQSSLLPNQGILINFKMLPTLIAASWVSQSLLRADSSSLTVNSSSGTNLVVNGDGEAGTVGAAAPSWSGSNLITANDSVFAGSKSLKVSVSASTLGGGQNVNLVGGQTYVLEGWVSEDALPSIAGQGAFIQLGIVSGITSYTILTKFGAYDAGNTTIPLVALPADGSSKSFTFLQCYFIPATSGTVTVSLLLSSNGTVSCHFDEVKLYPFNGAIYTGLSASTAYHLYSYCQESTGNLLFANGAPPPTSVSDTFAQSTNLDGRIGFQPCSVTTPSSGTGSGTGGGSGTCPECNEPVEIQRYSDAGELMFAGEIKAGEVQVGYESDDGLVKRGDFIKGHSFTKGMDVYRAVQKAMLVHCNGWVIVDGHRVTACEHIYKNNQWMPAWKAPGATHNRLSSWKVLIQVEADWEDEHNFYVGDLLIHNSLILPC